jgi:hypothetical protein
MDRITRAMVERKAELFAKLMGRTYGEGEGSYWLDYIACYGGYTLVLIGPRGSHRTPFGSKRRKAQEMWNTIDFACEAIRLQQEAQAADQAS